jgi:hypothetical protein
MTNHAREVVRHLRDGEPDYGSPCWVGHGGDLEPCKRPSTVRVYGIPLCPEHGEEAAAGAYEEIHQDAHDFFDRYEGTRLVGMPNPWVRRAVGEWRRTVPADEIDHEGRTEEALRRAFPFRADKVCPETALQVANPIPENGHPVDNWRDDRQDIHAVMRVAFDRGMDWLVESLEREREGIAAQCAYAMALTRGEHPEVLERARRENDEAERRVAGRR